MTQQSTPRSVTSDTATSLNPARLQEEIKRLRDENKRLRELVKEMEDELKEAGAASWRTPDQKALDADLMCEDARER